MDKVEIKEFKGNFFEIGRQQGEIYRKRKMSVESATIDPQLFEKQLRVYEKHYPEFLEEIRGISSSSGLDADKLIYNFITGEISRLASRSQIGKACTIFGVKGNNGVFVGRNYDWHPDTSRVFEAYKVINPGRNSFIAITDMGIVAGFKKIPSYIYYDPDDAINDKGLFIGLTFAYNDNWSYGLSCTHMIKLIAETCSTVADAIKTFSRVPLCGPKNFFVADKNGDMAVVEHTSKKFKVVYPENGVLIQTNHYVDQELAKEDTVLAINPVHNTFLRYYETLQKINDRKQQFNVSDAIRILGNVKSCACQNTPDIKTIWSLSMDIKRQKYMLYWDVTGNRKSMTLKV